MGLGKMGTRMVEKLLLDGHVVVAWNRSREVTEQFRLVLGEKHLEERFIAPVDIQALVKSLTIPRVLWMMVPAGEATETLFQEILKFVEKGDIIIDGGNSFYKDTERRSKIAGDKGVRYLGIGVSGGIKAAENGYPLMVGGDRTAYFHIEPILETLKKPNGGHAYFGIDGAGHFVKMVHNGIEYGMMQAIGEGFGVLEKAPYNFSLVDVAKLWQKGTIVSSFLLDCAKEALEKDPRLEGLDGVISATGEAEWTVKQGREEHVPVENIEQSLDFRRRSSTDTTISSSFAARMVAALRREFGGHAVKTK